MDSDTKSGKVGDAKVGPQRATLDLCSPSWHLLLLGWKVMELEVNEEDLRSHLTDGLIT